MIAQEAPGALEHLIERAKAGDSSAFEQVYARYARGVGEFCARKLGSEDAGRDAAQEVFSRVRQKLAHYDTGRPFRPWLMTVAANYCRDILRRRQTEATVLEHHRLEREGSFAVASKSPLGQLVQDERGRELRCAIDGLPDPMATVLRLRYFEDRSYADIAQALDADRNQVASWLYRARKLLRAQLTPNDESGDCAP